MLILIFYNLIMYLNWWYNGPAKLDYSFVMFVALDILSPDYIGQCLADCWNSTPHVKQWYETISHIWNTFHPFFCFLFNCFSSNLKLLIILWSCIHWFDRLVYLFAIEFVQESIHKSEHFTSYVFKCVLCYLWKILVGRNFH